MDDIKYAVAFSRIPSIGTVRMRLLESAFSSMQEAWEAPASALKDAGLTASALQQVTSRRPSIDPDREMELLELAGVRALSWHDDDYPAALKAAYGREACHTLVRDLAAAGVTIISGLARGIDAIAHTTALDEGGRTLAVMGAGIDVIYPADHKQLGSSESPNLALCFPSTHWGRVPTPEISRAGTGS